MKALLASTLAVAALLCTDPARSAKIVTIDFEDQTQNAVVVADLTIRSFRFSPNCHYDLLGPGPPQLHGITRASGSASIASGPTPNLTKTFWAWMTSLSRLSGLITLKGPLRFSDLIL